MNRANLGQPFASTFIATLLVLLAFTLVSGQENYPFTVAPMFALDVENDRPRYTMHFLVSDAEGEHEVSPKALMGVHPRQFFIRFYGTSERWAYHGSPQETDWASFSERMALWFSELSKRHAARTGLSPTSAQLTIRRKYPEPAEEYVIGTFDPQSSTFTAPRKP